MTVSLAMCLIVRPLPKHVKSSRRIIGAREPGYTGTSGVRHGASADRHPREPFSPVPARLYDPATLEPRLWRVVDGMPRQLHGRTEPMRSMGVRALGRAVLVLAGCAVLVAGCTSN